jgi:Ca2+-binding RTX toxin-like protein
VAKITTDMGYGYALDWRGLDFGDLPGHRKIDADENDFAVSRKKGYSYHFSGDDFRYDSDGMLYAGTVTGFRSIVKGKTAWEATGLKLDAELVARAADTGRRSDALKVFEAALQGSDRFVGSRADDTFAGYAGNDTLIGGKGDDTLIGGAGKDMMMGGAGYDTFVFDAKLGARSNVDTITDFEHGRDRIALDNDVFKGLPEGLSASLGEKLIYDGARHDLYFDRDGGDDVYKPVKFAHFSSAVTLDGSDFMVT